MSQENMPTTPGEEEPRYSTADILDRSDPKSIINLVPKQMAVKIESLPKEFFGVTERALKDVVKKGKVRLEATDHQLRIAFWNEYDQSQNARRRFMIVNVYGGVCSRQYFDLVCENKLKLAWIMCPPTRYVEALEELHSLGMRRLREIMDQDPFQRDKDGKVIKVNATLAAVQVKITEMTDNRLKGSILQRTQSLHMHAKASLPDRSTTESLDELNKRIAELQMQASLGSSPSPESGDKITVHEDAVVIETTHREVGADDNQENSEA